MARNRIWAFVKKVAGDIDDQFWSRSGPHGAAELGAALFNGQAYVMYGHAGRPGGEPPAPEHPKPEQAGPEPEQQPDRERKGRSR